MLVGRFGQTKVRLLGSRRRRPRCVLLTYGALICIAAAMPATARAEVQTIDFDSAPPALGAPLDSAGDVSFPTAQGYRPYRSDVGALAHSGTTVGDLGRCAQEVEATGGEPGSCEFFRAHSRGVLARTAKSVTLFAGRFGPEEAGEEPEFAILTAFDAVPQQIATTGLVAIDASGFDQQLSVSDPDGKIASFKVEAVLGANGEFSGPDLGIDDLAVNFADGGEPDFAVATTLGVVALVQGQSVDVPVEVPRLNGSNGPVELSLSGLPTGVSAAPVEIPGTQTSAKITLSASPTAPDTDFTPIEATLTADPLGNANVGPAPRTTKLSVRVAADFELRVPGATSRFPNDAVRLEVPECASVDVPVTIDRDIAMTRDVALSVHGLGDQALPAGVSAEFLPDATVPPGGNLVAHRTLRLRADSTSSLGEIVLEGQAGSPVATSQKLKINLVRQESEATIPADTLTSDLGFTPRYGREGSKVRIEGTGFCSGTMVEVGNKEAITTATASEHTLEFNVPRYATTGPVKIIPPSGKSYTTKDSLRVDDFRNTDGFPFPNYHLQGINASEFAEAFGADDVFISVNPCWPFGSCNVVTGVLNPVAALDWSLMNAVFNNAPTSGHCFGMALAIQRFLTGRESYKRFPSSSGSFPAKNVFDLGSESGPGSALDSYLDALQARVFSQELVSAWVRRDKSLVGQLGTLRREFEHNRPVVTTVHGGGVSNIHAVVAYDMAPTATGWDIYTYINLPYSSQENSNPALHRHRIDDEIIHVDMTKKTWSFDFSHKGSWEGEDDGTLWALPNGTMPDDPSLPGAQSVAEALAYLSFRSDGTVRAIANPPLALLGLIDATKGQGGPGREGTFVSRHVGRPLAVTFVGRQHGTYTQSYAAPGFVASADDVPTAPGVRDRVMGAGDSFAVSSGEARDLTLKLAREEGAAAATSATLDTHASADGTDTAAISDNGTLAYAHDGAPTTLSFTLTKVRRDGGPATFISGPVPVAAGERLSVRPADRSLHRVRLVVHGAKGGTRVMVLRNRGRARKHLKIGTPKVHGRGLSLPFRLQGVHGRAIVGVSLRLMSGRHLVAHRAVARRSANGTGKIAWRLPRGVARGRYRLVADLRAVTTGALGSTMAGSVSGHRATRVHLR